MADETTQQTNEEQIEELVEDQVEELVDEQVAEPVVEEVAEPVEEAEEEPAEDPVEEAVFEEPVEEAEEEPADETEDGATSEDRHREHVVRIAEGIAALVAKGEQVVAALNAKAEEAGFSFDDTAAAANSKVEDLASTVQAHVEQAAAQIAQDLETIAQTVDEKTGSGDEDAGDTIEEDEPEDATPYQPRFTEGAQAFRERMRVGDGSELLLTDPEFVERFANFAFDDVPADVDLPDRTRFMCWLATLLGCQGVDEFRALLPAALNIGLEPEAIKEVVYQASAYLGIGRVYPFLMATNRELIFAGVELPLKAQATIDPTEQSRYEGGEQAQIACFGEQMRGFKDRGADDYPYINQWLVKNCFGDWYTRGGLTIAERELCTFCFLAAQGGCEAQLKSHVMANVQCGNDREFLIKVVSNNVPFIGYPRSLNAMAVVEEVTSAQE